MFLTDDNFYHYTLLTLYLITPPTFIACQFLTAPYGKHTRPGWGPTLPPPLAWFLMESPTLWVPLSLFTRANNRSNPLSYLLISPYLVHYTHRTLIYPIKLLRTKTAARGRIRGNNIGQGRERIHGEARRNDIGEARRETRGNTNGVARGNTIGEARGFPVSVALMAFVFNLLNGYVQGRWVSHYADVGHFNWARFGVGLVIWAVGMGVNVWADKVLVGLKSEGGGYKIPRGGLFEYVSCPNYFGEMVEWLGWAVMTWSWAGFGFFLYTCANLVPRAASNHQWYLRKFGEDYPRKRKAVIPYLY